MADMADQIRQLLDPVLDSLGLSLWDMDFQKHGPKWLLRIYIDREASGVTLNDCEAVSRDLGAALDVEDIIPHAYTLEVSSPGLDRKLTKPEHFIRFAGSAINMKTFQQINGQKVFHGKLLGLAGESVQVELDTGVVVEISIGNVARASLQVSI
ncbi:MAG: ribosome maturation factor RimP [Betaproteobacteria bacterium]